MAVARYVISVLKRLLRRLPQRCSVERHHPSNRDSQRQSSAELFSRIYREKHWGGAHLDFYSGSGSHLSSMIEPWVAAVRTCLATFPEPPVVVDIGCGDFAAAARLVDRAAHYHGCDVVPELIERNRRLFKVPNVTFHLLDAVNDPLPRGDLVIIKQVLQHLDNAQVAAIVRQLSQYPVWIVTEHIPAGDFAPNHDMPTSGYTRLLLGSGIVLTREPFRIAPKAAEVLCEVMEDGNPIRTVAYRF